MDDQNPKVSIDGTKRWFKDGLLHREDGPAIIYAESYTRFYKNGERVRMKDVVYYPKRTMFWITEGKLHREDGPAIEFNDGSKWWYKNGEKERTKK